MTTQPWEASDERPVARHSAASSRDVHADRAGRATEWPMLVLAVTGPQDEIHGCSAGYVKETMAGSSSQPRTEKLMRTLRGG